jgi:hypothetical protein
MKDTVFADAPSSAFRADSPESFDRVRDYQTCGARRERIDGAGPMRG